ncbi:MAG TPA: 4'-phosphopantetheinyl transferase superfamily protein [Pseudomonadales bacterium]|nr:4'-phosphopantetheinyl transferase superfamily protein [Pseudomonadales bacterium]
MPDSKLIWKLPPGQPPLAGRDVHIWEASLNKSGERFLSLEQMLSQDERARARQFKFETDRNRFIAGRGLLRTILGSYAQTDPAQLHFTYSKRGKPALRDISGQSMLHFNVAHSKDLILIAVTRACAVGVDVEWIHPINDAEDIAARFFSPRETAKLMALANEQRIPAFFYLWTRKEAWLKATGDGISEMLNQVEVSFLPEEPASVLAISGNVEAAQRWTMMGLPPAPGFAAAITMEARDLQFSCWQWPG